MRINKFKLENELANEMEDMIEEINQFLEYILEEKKDINIYHSVKTEQVPTGIDIMDKEIKNDDIQLSIFESNDDGSNNQFGIDLFKQTDEYEWNEWTLSWNDMLDPYAIRSRSDLKSSVIIITPFLIRIKAEVDGERYETNFMSEQIYET